MMKPTNLIRGKFFYKCDSILNGIQPQKLKLLESAGKALNLKKNKILFKEDAYSNGMFYLVKGKVKIYQLNPDGKFQIVYIYTAGEYFGYRPLLCQAKNAVSAETLEDCKLIFYSKKAFETLLETSPVFMKNLLHALSFEFNIWVNLMTAFSHKAVKERVGLALLILHEKYNSAHLQTDNSINLGREDLAHFSNTTIETCVRVLKQLKQNKIIRTEGRDIWIIDEPKLLELTKMI